MCSIRRSNVPFRWTLRTVSYFERLARPLPVCSVIFGLASAVGVFGIKMTKLQLLSAYLTERLTAVVKEVLDVVEDTVAQYREETARTRRENESLRRQLRDILLLEAESEWLSEARSKPRQKTASFHPYELF